MASEPGYFLFLFFQFQREGKISAVIHEVIKCYWFDCKTRKTLNFEGMRTNARTSLRIKRQITQKMRAIYIITI